MNLWRHAISLEYLTPFLRRGILTAIVLTLTVTAVWGASSPTKITIHVPGKTLNVMAFYFGKDKGFFSQEGIDAQLVAMAPPTAIVDSFLRKEPDWKSTCLNSSN